MKDYRYLAGILIILFVSMPVAVPAAPGEAGTAEVSVRHHVSERNSSFNFDRSQTFADYLSETEQMIRATRKDLERTDSVDVVEINRPFELIPDPQSCPQRKRVGVLLVHGLTDSPFLMRDIGEALSKRCYLARAIVLPGHATVPGDLLKVQYKEWVKAVRYGIDSFDEQTDAVYVVGFSTGAAAALYNVLSSPDTAKKVRALMLLSPALKPKSKFAFMANWFKFRSKFKTEAEYADLPWLEVAADEDYAKYESFAKNAADQIHLLTKEVQDRDCKLLRVPMFMVVSEDDDTVSAEASIECFKSQPDKRSVLLLYTKNAGENRDDKRIIPRNSVYKAERIMDFSHTAIPVAPENRHYGRDGDYKNCMHYLGDKKNWELCKSDSEEVQLGEKTKENLKEHTIRRLTYNPDFDGMLTEMDRFLKGLTP